MSGHGEVKRPPEGFKLFGNVYVDKRVPMLESLPPGREGKKLLTEAVRSSKFPGHFHPPAAIKDLDLKRFGFRPTRVAYPMDWERGGEVSWRSGRLHAHKAGDIYMVHEDTEAPGTGAKALLNVSHGVRDLAPWIATRLRHLSDTPVIIPGVVKKAEAEEPSTLRRYGMPIAGAGLGTALAAGGLIAARPALRAEFLGKMRALRHGRLSTLGLESSTELPKEVRQKAEAVVAHLRQQGVDPKKVRIGVSGVGGSGKSSLSRAIAEEAGLGFRPGDESLGRGGFGARGFDIGQHFSQYPAAPGTVAEHTHLLNQVDPDTFDVMVHLDKPMEDIKKQMYRRGRGAFQLEYVDYPKTQRGVRHAFEHTAGDPHEVAPGIRLKVKGPGGFQAQQHLEQEAARRGINIAGLSREQAVHSLAAGRRSQQIGDLAYVRKGKVLGHAGLLGAGGVAGAAAGNRLVDDQAAAGR